MAWSVFLNPGNLFLLLCLFFDRHIHTASIAVFWFELSSVLEVVLFWIAIEQYGSPMVMFLIVVFVEFSSCDANLSLLKYLLAVHISENVYRWFTRVAYDLETEFNFGLYLDLIHFISFYDNTIFCCRKYFGYWSSLVIYRLAGL